MHEIVEKGVTKEEISEYNNSLKTKIDTLLASSNIREELALDETGILDSSVVAYNEVIRIEIEKLFEEELFQMTSDNAVEGDFAVEEDVIVAVDKEIPVEDKLGNLSNNSIVSASDKKNTEASDQLSTLNEPPKDILPINTNTVIANSNRNGNGIKTSSIPELSV